MFKKTSLIFGGGSKFGLHLSKELHKLLYNVEIVTSSSVVAEKIKTHKIDWLTCEITKTEKLCNSLSNVDILIFNQNFSKISNLENIDIQKLEMWKKIKIWQQSQFINCQLPLQVCNSLLKKNKISKNTIVVWMLSGCIKDTNFHNLEYKLQKYINNEVVNYVNNLGFFKCIGFFPGKLTENNYQIKAHNFCNFLKNNPLNSKNVYYSFNNENIVVDRKN
jgi:hypothetical protein